MSATITEFASHRLNTATGIASVYVQGLSIALQGRYSATRYVTVCVVTAKIVQDLKYSTKKRVNVNARLSRSAELRLYSARILVIVSAM